MTSGLSKTFIHRLRGAQARCAVALGGLSMMLAGCGGGGLPEPEVKAENIAALRRVDVAGAGGGVGQAAVSGWFTLKGRFTYNGAPPAMAGISVSKDPLCKVPLKEETLLVDSGTKGLANVVIYLNDAPAVHPDLLAAPPKEVLWDQKECRFLAHVSGLQTKDKWVILNSDAPSHNALFAPGRGNKGDNVLLPTGQRYEYSGFKNPVTAPFEVTCSIHSWMKAYVLARPDPYFAVTAPDGTFAIEKLPAGIPLEFVVWHERGAGDNHALKAKADWSNRGRFKLPAPKDGEVVTLDIPVEPSALQ